MGSASRRPRADGDLRHRHPVLVEWIEQDRQDAGPGGRVAEWLARYRSDRAAGPTWYAVADFVRPDLASVPERAWHWYASQLVHRLLRQGWLTVRGVGAGAPLQPGPLADPSSAGHPMLAAVDDGPGWVTERLF
jgi:hypothetical protein